MIEPLPVMRLTGATVLRDGAMQSRSVGIAEGWIARGPFPEVDLTGYLVLPGAIDLAMMAVGGLRGGNVDAMRLLRQAERTAAMAGTTTAWLTFDWPEDGCEEGAETLLRALDRQTPEAIMDLRVALACDTHRLPPPDRFLSVVRRFGIERVVFSRGAGPQRGAEPEADRGGIAPRVLCRIAEALDVLGVVYGSIRDADGETRDTFAMLGARVCEAPLVQSAASIARATGDAVIAHAEPRQGAAPGRASLDGLVRNRTCDVIASGERPAALADLALSLARRGLMDLPRAWAAISATPADLMGLTDRGVIAPGKRADLTIVNAATGQVEATIVAGRLVFATGAAVMRFIGAAAPVAHAAE